MALLPIDNMEGTGYTYTMSDKQITMKVWQKTLKKLRMLYALSGDSMVSILDRLITAELEKEQKRQNKKG